MHRAVKFLGGARNQVAAGFRVVDHAGRAPPACVGHQSDIPRAVPFVLLWGLLGSVPESFSLNVVPQSLSVCWVVRGKVTLRLLQSWLTLLLALPKIAGAEPSRPEADDWSVELEPEAHYARVVRAHGMCTEQRLFLDGASEGNANKQRKAMLSSERPRLLLCIAADSG